MNEISEMKSKMGGELKALFCRKLKPTKIIQWVDL